MNPRLENALVAVIVALGEIPAADIIDRDPVYHGIREAEAQLSEAWSAAGGALNMDGEPELGPYLRERAQHEAADAAFDHARRAVG